MEEFDIVHGADGVGESDLDFEIAGEIKLPPLVKQNTIRYEYNQGSSTHCTLYGPIGAISDLKDYRFTDSDIQGVIDLSVQRGKILNRGWQTQLGVRCACDWWNSKNPDNKVLYFKIDILSNNFLECLKNGYTVVLTFKGNSTYTNDHYQDGMVDGTDFSPTNRGHCLTGIFKDNKVVIKDNYKGRKRKDGSDDNYYGIKDLVGLVKNNIYYPTAYIIVDDVKAGKSIEELKQIALAKQLIETAKKMYDLGNDEVKKYFQQIQLSISLNKLLKI